MANTIILKRSATQNNVPTTSQLELGEVAINTYDGKVYIKKSVSGTASIVEVGPVASVNGSTGAVVVGTDEVSEGSSNLYYTDARARAAISAGTGISYNSTTGEVTTAQDITTSGSPSFAGLTLTGNASVQSLIPSSDNVYSLGSSSAAFADIYVGPGSLYVNGKKVIEDDSNTMTVSTDADQDLRLTTSGSGSVELLASGTGNIQIMGGLQLQTSNRITDSAGVNVEFGDVVHMNSNKITNVGTPTASGDAATKGYVDTELSNLVDSAPATLDTLNELAAALGDDANFSTTITNSIATKLDSADYTAADVLTKIKTVDGASSGLDADLLDGEQGSYYLNYANFTGTPGAATLQSVIDAGNTSTTTAVIPFLYANQSAFPSASTYHGAIAHSHSDGAMFFAHGGNWVELGNITEVATGNGLSGTITSGSGTLTMSGSYSGTFAVTGDITATGEVTAYFSDERLKTDIKPVENALEGVMAMGGYNYKANDLAKELGVERVDNQIGLLAQEVEAVFPELVTESGLEGYKTIRYDKMVTVLVEAMKEQQRQIEQLQADVKKTLH